METKEKKDRLEKLITIIVIFAIIVSLYVGFIAGSTYELNHTTDINKQHEELVLEGTYNYCPYCGEQLSVKN